MDVRGDRECKECGTRWSYFETGSVACPDCGSLRSVGTGERRRHTDAPAELDLTSVLAEIDGTPLVDLVDEIKSECRAYLRKRGFIRGGDLAPLDDAYLAAAELRHAADVYGRIAGPGGGRADATMGERGPEGTSPGVTDDEEWYVTALLRATDTGERPSAGEVPPRMHEARGLAAAEAVLEYRTDVARYLEDHPDPEASRTLGAVRDRAKRIDALEGDVAPAEADALVDAAVELGRYLVADDVEALASARERLDDTE
ncbi:hypothetical protein GRX01_15540 [Halobaculum sp. WSA2]|uniref:TFIIB-type zinc ribbon-containing protein n=1 Tax=Halobaculum saliterrae TaxID=2073113 RepID=A0A6B0SZ14_9EURY|nr:hypothetical protein [Halobaculum saliterrae]MXR42746.1 hypothetical protein [Halobaculum saliterrae]